MQIAKIIDFAIKTPSGSDRPSRQNLRPQFAERLHHEIEALLVVIELVNEIVVNAALAEEGSFTRTAHRMNIVQSGLSISIKALEQELGTRLFDRTTRKSMLTPAGALFPQHARAGLVMFDSGVQAVRSQDGIVRG